jgi:hypothetical protein
MTTEEATQQPLLGNRCMMLPKIEEQVFSIRSISEGQHRIPRVEADQIPPL